MEDFYVRNRDPASRCERADRCGCVTDSYAGGLQPWARDRGVPVLVDLERYQLITQLEGHVGRVFSARWIAGGQILTAGGDGTVQLWDGTTGQLRQTYRGGSQPLYDATLLSDGLVIAGGADGRLRFWAQASGHQLWTL